MRYLLLMRRPAGWLHALGPILLLVRARCLKVEAGGADRFPASTWKSQQGNISAFTSTALPWEELFTAAGDLDDESPVLQSQGARMLTSEELLEQERLLATGDAGRPRGSPLGSARAAACGAHPQPYWTSLGPRGRWLRYNDTESEYPLQVDFRINTNAFVLHSSAQDLSALRDKWVYMYGDSTMRQQCQDLAERLSDIAAPSSNEEFRKCQQIACPIQGATGYSTTWPLDWEWHYHCGSGSPDPAWNITKTTATWFWQAWNLTLTCDWKMHIFRRHDRWLLKRRFALEAPDIFIVTAGMHDCSWKVPLDMGREYNALQVRVLFGYLNAFLPATTKLLWLSAQLTINQAGNRLFQKCISGVNDAARTEAIAHNVTFVDKEHITGRLIKLLDQRSSLGEHLSRDGTHFKPFVHEIVGHYLLRASSCLLA